MQDNSLYICRFCSVQYRFSWLPPLWNKLVLPQFTHSFQYSWSTNVFILWIFLLIDCNANSFLLKELNKIFYACSFLYFYSSHDFISYFFKLSFDRSDRNLSQTKRRKRRKRRSRRRKGRGRGKENGGRENEDEDTLLEFHFSQFTVVIPCFLCSWVTMLI